MPLLGEDTLRDALVYTGVAVALALLSLLAPRERRKGPFTMAALALVALGGLWLLWRFGTRVESRTLHDILREALLALLAIGIMRAVLLFGARVLLARFAIPSIVTDVLLGLGLIAYALVRLNAVGVNIAGIVTTSAVITGAIAFGTMCRKMMRHSGRPSACAAVTKSRSRSDRNSARTKRAVPIQLVIPMTIMML